MQVKVFEVRDRATFMPVMGIRLETDEDKEGEFFLLRRAGYATGQILGYHGATPYIILVKLDGVEAQYDPFKWDTPARTIPIAHRYIIEHWDDLYTGQVVDVEYILGERIKPKKSERFSA
jgi:hypothetical protein